MSAAGQPRVDPAPPPCAERAELKQFTVPPSSALCCRCGRVTARRDDEGMPWCGGEFPAEPLVPARRSVPDGSRIGGTDLMRKRLELVDIDPPGPCWLCGKKAYAKDEQGPLHPCCFRWRRVIEGGGQCPACAESAKADEEWTARQERKAAAEAAEKARQEAEEAAQLEAEEKAARQETSKALSRR